jgi:hypothetical protein
MLTSYNPAQLGLAIPADIDNTGTTFNVVGVKSIPNPGRIDEHVLVVHVTEIEIESPGFIVIGDTVVQAALLSIVPGVAWSLTQHPVLELTASVQVITVEVTPFITKAKVCAPLAPSVPLGMAYHAWIVPPQIEQNKDAEVVSVELKFPLYSG